MRRMGFNGLAASVVAVSVIGCSGSGGTAPTPQTNPNQRFDGPWRLVAAGGRTPPYVVSASAADTTTRYLATIEVTITSPGSVVQSFASSRDSIVHKVYIGPTTGWFLFNQTASAVHDVSVRADTLVLTRTIGNTGPVLQFAMRPDGSLVPVEWLSGKLLDERWTR